MNHRRRKTRRKKSCGLCKPQKRAGNSRKLGGLWPDSRASRADD